MSWWVTELECELEFARRESQGWTAEVTEERAAELLATKQATTAERGLEAAKVR